MKHEKILIIDDDDELLGIYSKILSKEGYKVEVAADGLAGFNKVIEDKPNLILLDMVLPNMDGLEILKKIKSDPNLNDIYVLLITASPDVTKLLLKGSEAGADGYFMKGIPNTELVARVHAAFRHINTILSLKTRENELLVLNKTLIEGNEELNKLNKKLKESQTASLNLLSDLRDEIEERKEVQKSFIESEKRFRDLISNVRLLSVTLDLEGNITFCNDYLLELTGWKYEEAIGKSWFKNFLPDNISDEVLEIFQNSINTNGYPRHYVNEILTRNGEKRIIEWNNTTLRDSEGNIAGAASIGNDITELTESHNKIKKISNYYTTLIEKSSDGVAILDEESNFKYISPAGRKMFGYNNSETVIGDPSSLTHPDDLQTVLTELEKLVQNPDHTPILQYRFKNKSGSWIWIESTFTNLLSDPAVKGIVINFREITERMKAEQRLKESENLLKKAEIMSEQGSWKWDILNDKWNFSENWLNLHGFDHSDISTSELMELAHPDDRVRIKKAMEDALSNKKPYLIEHRIIRKDDAEVRNVKAIGEVHFSENGKPIFMIGVGKDITESKKVANDLKESEEKYRNLFNRTPAMIHSVDSDGHLLNVSDYWLQKMGYGRDEVIGKQCGNFLTEESKRYSEDAGTPNFDETGLINDLPLQFIKKNGEVIDTLLSAISEFNDKGEITRTIAVLDDITLRKRAEKAFSDSKTMIERIIDNVPVRIFWKDKNLVYQGCNQEFAKDAGFSSTKEIIGKDDYQMGWREEADLYRADDKQVIDSGKPKLLIEEEQTTPQGEKITLLTSKIPLRNSDGKINGVLGTYLDITERKKVEDKLIQSESKFRLVWEKTADGMRITNEKGIVILANPAYCLLMGKPLEEIMGQPISVVYESSNRKHILKQHQKLFSSKSIPQYLEKEITLWNGKRVYLELSNSFLEIENQPLLSLSVFRDITKKKEADKLLAEANNIINRSLTVVFLWKNVENLPVEFVTNNVNKLFGYSAKDFLEEKITYDKIIHSEDHDRVLAELKYHSNRGEVQSYYHEPYRIVNKDGDIKWVEDQTYIRRNVQGEITHYEGIISDITQRIKIEEKLREQNLFMDSLLNSIPLPVFYKDKYGKYFSVNNSFENIFGITKEAIIGKTVFDLNPPDLAEIYFTKDKELLENGGVQVYETQIKTKNDLRRHVIFNKSVFTNAKGETEGLIGVIQDITERKLMDMKLQQSENELRIAADRYRKAQEMGHVGNWEYDIQQDTFWGSDEAKRIYGFDVNSENFTVEEVEKLIPERDRVHQSLVDLIEFNKEYNLEFQIDPLNSNEPKIIHSIAEVVMDEEKNSVKVIGVVQDVTERKKTEIALKESEEKYRLLHEYAGLGIGYISPKGIVLSFNTIAAKDMNGVPEDFEGKSIFDLFPKAAADDYLKRLTKTVNSNKALVFEDFVQLPDQKKWFLSTYTKIIDAKKNILGIQIISQDITERKKIEDVLRAEKIFSESLISNLPGVFYLINEDRKFLRWNTLFEEVTGRSAEEMATISPTDLFEGEDKQAIATAIKRVFSHGLVQVMAHIVTKNGKRIPYQFTGHKIIVDGATCLIGVGLDYSEKKEAEEKMRRSSLILEEMSNMAKIGGWEIDLANMKAYFTTETFNIYGLKQSEVPSIEEGINYYAPESRPVIKKAVENAIENQTPYNVEVKLIDATGTAKWVQTKGKLDIVDGEAKRLYGTLQDITEKKKIEEALKESEQFLRAIFDNSLNAIMVADDLGNYLFVNKAAADMFGYSEKELLKLNVGQLRTSIPENSSALYKKYIKSGKDIGEFEFIKADGEKMIALYHAVRVKENFNLSILSDITEIKLLQDKLKEYNKELEKRVDERTFQLAKSEENYRTLAESMNAYICSAKSDQKIDYMNSKLLLQLKINPEEMIGKDVTNIFNLFNTKKNIKLANVAMKKRELTKIVAKAPWNKWIEWDLDFVKKSEAEDGNLIILGHDITERLEIENKTKEALAKERELGQLKSKFVSTVSHEFRTPLTSIYSSIELLERYGEKWVNEKKLNHFQRMKSSIERLTSMLEEMLLLGRAESNKTKFNPAYTNLNELCLSFIKDTKPLLAKDQHLKYNFNLSETNYLVDQNLLRIILTNLISNSIKYSPAGGNISLDVSEEKNKIKFSVTDSGMGISVKDIKNIFKPFYRTDNVSTISGSGLGLSIVKEYAKLHKGKIKVESELGQGSKFTLSIPKITKILKED